MVALLSPSSTKWQARPKGDAPVHALPTTLLTKRISELHRRLIDPTSDVKTVTDAKRALLHLLSDPMTLPVITTPPMEMPLFRNANTKRQSPEPNRVCEICDRPLPGPGSPIRVSHHETPAQPLASIHSLS